ncbi:MAG: type II toxin-antitoxin system YhaV family toxin, partial [Pseudomonadota bacterium]|nr:type II toxin-antitoxin system YhaV family toxin [Pseudomonadota bacterium]
MVIVNGWTLYEYPTFVRQIEKLDAQVAAKTAVDPEKWSTSSVAKLSQTIEHLILKVIPADPGAKQFRLGDALGKGRKHWFRAKFGN